MMATGASAFSVWGKVGEEHLQCPVCQDYFKQPKILSCQHSVCEACLEREKVSEVSSKVECPVCWQVTALPADGDVSALRTNFRLVDMVEAVHKLHQRQRGSVPVCSVHGWKESRLYCQACRKLICEVCTGEAQHSGHEHQAVGAAASEARRAAEESITAIQTLGKDLEGKLKAIQEVERDLKTAAKDSRQEVDQRANEEMARVRTAKQRIKDGIDTTEKARVRMLADCGRQCAVMGESLKSAVDGYCAAVDSGNYDGDYEFVSLQTKIAELAELGGRKAPEVDLALSVLRFERFEPKDNICLGRLVDK